MGKVIGIITAAMAVIGTIILIVLRNRQREVSCN
jgi:hypothetical protein